LAYSDNGQSTLFFNSNKAVAIHVPAGRCWTGPTDAPAPDLRILFVGSSFDKSGVSNPKLLEHIKKEWEAIEGAWQGLKGSDLVHLKPLNDPTPARLTRELDSFKPHVVHYYGHGFHFAGDECVVLADSDHKGRGRVLGWSELSEIFNAVRRRHLRLIVLNACRLGERGRLGRKLVGLGIPAVVTMRATIHADVVTSEFTPTFYKELAEGQCIHEAFRRAQQEIRWRAFRAVEAFVPTLVHGSLTGIPLLDRSRPEVDRVWRAAEEVRKAAEARQIHAEEIAEQLRRAFDSALGNWQQVAFHQSLIAAIDLAKEPAVTEALQELSADMAEALEEKAKQGDWTNALTMCAAAKTVVESVAEESSVRLRGVSTRIEEQARAAMATKKRELVRLHHEKKWVKLEDEARRYLDAMNDPDVIAIFKDAERFAKIPIVVEAENPTADARQVRRVLDLIAAGDVEQAGLLYDAIEPTLSQAQRDECTRMAEAAIVIQHRELVEQEREQISALMRAGNWDEAESRCTDLRETLTDASPEWEQLVQIHVGVREGHARQAERRRDWTTLRKIALQIRDDPEMRSLHGRAGDWLARSQKFLELHTQIVVLEDPGSAR
jgi:hypothetical protein